MDALLFDAINDLAGRFDVLDDLFELTSKFGPLLLIAMLLGLWFYPGAVAEREGRQWTVIAATAAASLALGVNQIIIRMWDRPRPFVGHSATMLASPSHDPSFPSDHATFAFAVAVAILLGSRRVGIAAMLIAAAIGLSRVYVGEHYLGDVLGGALIGGGCATVVCRSRAALFPLASRPLEVARRFRLA